MDTDEGVTGIGSGDTMAGFAGYADLFLGRDPLQIASHVRTLETISFHAGRFWPLEAALWDIVGKVAGLPVATLFGGARDSLPAYASFGGLRGARLSGPSRCSPRWRPASRGEDPDPARRRRGLPRRGPGGP